MVMQYIKLMAENWEIIYTHFYFSSMIEEQKKSYVQCLRKVNLSRLLLSAQFNKDVKMMLAFRSTLEGIYLMDGSNGQNSFTQQHMHLKSYKYIMHAYKISNAKKIYRLGISVRYLIFRNDLPENFFIL
jgi:hypothetical protein